ncbi:MAG: hypothetical protein LC800_06895 [Acidobacteria bacterium]|nr:hypothetical protein [Acidobacteriota bacterium]
MSVALSSVAMRLVELITVYLAFAAPVGVWFFLRLSPRARPHRLTSASAAALLWPLVILSLHLTREKLSRGIKAMTKKYSPAANGPTRRDAKADEFERGLLEALHGLEDAARESCGEHAGPTADAARSACASVERFTGLTLAASRADFGGEPAGSELELARVSGRTGADLEAAGRCVHRRNVARLQAHRRNARVELLHALADLPDTFAPSLLARPADFRASRRLYAALLPVYGRAIELLSIFGDSRGVQTIARLFDNSASRLRQLDALAGTAAAPEAAAGDEPCTPPDSQPAPHAHTLPSEAPTLSRV